MKDGALSPETAQDAGKRWWAFLKKAHGIVFENSERAQEVENILLLRDS